MSLRSNVFAAAVGAAALITAVTAAAADAPAAKPDRAPCFFVTQWQGWKSPSPDIIYLKVNNRDVYQVDLSAGSYQLQSAGYHLVSQVRGSSSICSALDLDLAVSDGRGFSQPLIAKSLTKLTPEQVAAIPPKYRP